MRGYNSNIRFGKFLLYEYIVPDNYNKAVWLSSVGIKPTTLMYANAPLPAALQQCQLDSVQRPEGLLIGKNSSGQYKTAAAKEYPEALNRSFAIALTALVTKCAAASEHFSSDIEPYGSELVAMAVNNSIQPDYQPH